MGKSIAMKKIKIIFLDIDGVLNSNRFFTTVDNKLRIAQHDKYGDMFDPISATLLNKLISTTNAKVVVSSTWRHQGFEKMKQMWIDRKMTGEVIGTTPSFGSYRNGAKQDVTIPRGSEIQWYYENKHFFRHWNWDGEYVQAEKKKCDLASYVILDDDSDMLYEQRNNFVHCNGMMGFMEPEYERAHKILMTV